MILDNCLFKQRHNSVSVKAPSPRFSPPQVFGALRSRGHRRYHPHWSYRRLYFCNSKSRCPLQVHDEPPILLPPSSKETFPDVISMLDLGYSQQIRFLVWLWNPAYGYRKFTKTSSISIATLFVSSGAKTCSWCGERSWLHAWTYYAQSTY